MMGSLRRNMRIISGKNFCGERRTSTNERGLELGIASAVPFFMEGKEVEGGRFPQGRIGIRVFLHELQREAVEAPSPGMLSEPETGAGVWAAKTGLFTHSRFSDENPAFLTD